jgi:hypothetical protein
VLAVWTIGGMSNSPIADCWFRNTSPGQSQLSASGYVNFCVQFTGFSPCDSCYFNLRWYPMNVVVSLGNLQSTF